MCVGPLAPKDVDIAPPSPPPPPPNKTPDAAQKLTTGRSSAASKAARSGNNPLRINLSVAQPSNGISIPQG